MLVSTIFGSIIFPLLQLEALGQATGHVSCRATQGRKCFPWQMHVELPLENITSTIPVTPFLISELICLLSNRHEGHCYAQHYGKNVVNVSSICGRNMPLNGGIYKDRLDRG